MQAMPDVPAERRISKARASDAEWRRFLDEKGWPASPSIDADRLVVLAPHPDDEALACGALIADHVSGGGRCLVMAATDGEASHGELSAPERGDLAARRRYEQTRSASLLGGLGGGVTIVRLGAPDGRLSARQPALAEWLAEHLRVGDVLVSTWTMDGHPDHEACGRSAQRAAARLGLCLMQAPVWAWHWSTPGDVRVPWDRVFRFTPSTAALEAKERAVRAHTTQLTPQRERGPVLDQDILARAAWPFEYFIV